MGRVLPYHAALQCDFSNCRCVPLANTWRCSATSSDKYCAHGSDVPASIRTSIAFALSKRSRVSLIRAQPIRRQYENVENGVTNRLTD